MRKFTRILIGLILFVSGLCSIVACLTYQSADASWNTGTTETVHNLLGIGGACVADILHQLFGRLDYFVPIASIVFGFFLLRHVKWLWFRFFMFAGALLGACWLMGGSMVEFNLTANEWKKTEAAGFIGFYLRQWIPAPAGWLSIIGWIVVAVLFVLGLKVPVFLICRWSSRTVSTGMSHVKMPRVSLSKMVLSKKEAMAVAQQSSMDEDLPEDDIPDDTDVVLDEPVKKTKKSLFARLKKEKKPVSRVRVEPTFESFGGMDTNSENFDAEENELDDVRPQKEKMAPRRETKAATRPAKSTKVEQRADKDNLKLPSTDLLNPVKSATTQAISKEKMAKVSADLEQVLKQFGVNGKVIGAHYGPVVTLYEFEPAPGIRSSRVIALAGEVAIKMCMPSVRIAAIPGESALGIEMPNAKRETVYIREMIENVKFQGNNGLLPLVLGKDIGGMPVFADLAKMPHLLVAGTTGSGKSVGINAMILSLLYRFTPAECRLIMVDPKMVELSVYNRIPHLLTPVVTESEKAVVALKWAVREMEDRYRSMMHLGVRNIESYNQKLLQMAQEGKTLTRRVQTGFDADGKPIFEEQNFDLTPFPFIVIIVDEMADLMGQCGKEVDPLIQRLAQKSRAVGIHLILATQRPSVDVITGVIKSNFPSRISFQVRSKIDSRTILDEMGAEQLLGRGDMLYAPAGQPPQRVHGPYVSDEEVQNVVHHWEMQAEPEYLDAVITDVDSGSGGGGASGNIDVGSGDLYDQAVAIVLRDKKPTTSYIQRQLRIGYNKAADLIDRMEAEGVVSKPNVAGKREILVPTDNA